MPVGLWKRNIYSVNIEDGDGRKQLEVPLWFWNTDEWCGFTKASPKTHRTTIVHALKSVRSGNVFEEVSRQSELASFVRTAIDTIQVCKASGTPWGKFPLPKNFHQYEVKQITSLQFHTDSCSLWQRRRYSRCR